MKRKFAGLFLVALLVLSTNYVFAQYPKIPADVQKASNDMMREATRQSDIAWEKAKVIIEKESKEGKPYIPFAGRPTDLPNQNYLHFRGQKAVEPIVSVVEVEELS
jgi:hypothetical protein